MSQTNTADIIVLQLVAWGVKRVYGVAGDANLHLLDALSRNRDIQFVQARHETAAAFMASAEAKLTGEVGVCTGTSGPGLVNMLNGLGDAALDKVPVLAITGQVATNEIGMPVKQYLDQQVMVQPLVLWSAQLSAAQTAAELTWLGLHYATNGGGVAHLSVPLDLWSQQGGGEVKSRPKPDKSAQVSEEVIQNVTEIINSSKKPVIMIGRGIAVQVDTVKEFAEKIQAPLITTLPAKGLIPEEYHLCLGGLGQAGTEAAGNILKNSDLVLVLGATWWPKEYTPSHTVKIIQMDAAKKNLALKHPAAENLEVYIENILPVLLQRTAQVDRSGWLAEVGQERSSWLAKIQKEREDASLPIRPQFLMAQLEKVTPPEAVMVLDVGDHVIWYDRCWWGSNRELLISGTWRSMAFGLPAAIAAKSVYPDRPVICITGDGGLTMTMGEMITAVQQDTALKMVVVNNGSLAMEENRAEVAGMKKDGLKLLNPDFVQAARAFGWEAYRAEEAGELAAVLKKCMESSKPCLVDVISSVPMPPHTKL